MTSSMKQRIAQIRHGQVPKGCRLTRCGIVPGDWAELCLGDIYTERNEPGNENLPLLMVSIHSGVSDGEVDEAQLPKKVKRITDKTQYKRAASGDLAFNMMRAWQGAIGTVRTEGMVSPAYIVAVPNDKVDPLFMDYFVKMNRTVQYIHRQSYGVTDFRLRLYWDSFVTIPCVLPPLAEQRKIAKILATQDRVIELKKKLLEETKKRKKALLKMLMCPTEMKRLEAASPHDSAKRLEAASPRGEAASCRFGDGVWQKLNFGDCFHLLRTNTYSREFMVSGSRGIANIHYGDVLSKFDSILDFSCTEVDSLVANAPIIGDLLEDGDIVIADTAEDFSCGKAVEIHALGKRKAVAGLHTIACRPVAGCFEPKWIGYFINSEAFHGQLLPLMVGSKVSSITRQSLLSTIVVLPPLPIQRHIATILSAADREIDLLRQDLEQEKQKKKTLMQLLLTGIVRVNGKEAAGSRFSTK